MNALRCLIVFFILALSGLAGASNVVFVGNTSWEVSNKQCTFRVTKILNQDPAGSRSGSLRLCLWVKSSPNASKGYRVATYDLDTLPGGYSYNDFQRTTSCSIPKLTGKYYFSISLEEWGDSGWTSIARLGSSLKTLKNGNFTAPKKWKAPSGKVISPRKAIYVGETLSHTLQGSGASGGIVYVPNGTTIKLQIKIQENGTTTVYGGFRPEGAAATYTYSTGKASNSGKSYSVAKLNLIYGAETGHARSDMSLFFQKAKKGFYKSLDDYAGSRGASWGIFNIY